MFKEFEFHGAYSIKKNAKAKERKVKGFIRRVKIKGKTRYLVMTRKGNK